MLWSLIKILLFVAIVAAGTFGAGFLMESEGGIQITIGGTEFTLGPLQSVIAGMVLIVAVWLFLKLLSLLVAILRFLNGDETAISRFFDRSRERKGYEALVEGVMALASGEGKVAMNRAARAERYLGRPELTNLITAQAAEISGDRAKAEQSYRNLLVDDKTRFVGVRGILNQKVSDGDTETALKLAEKAHALKPGHQEVQDTLLKLQTKAEDWSGARSTLGTKLKTGALPRDVYRRRDAVLALSEARDVVSEDASVEKREAAIAANKMSPDLVPAAAMAAREYIKQGSKRYAKRVLLKAWQAQPHPDLAAAFAAIEPDETPQARITRFAKLIALQPDHAESKLVNAELHIAAEDFPGAKRALGDLPESDPDARVMTLMAAISRGQGEDDSVVRGWLARALSARRGPQWVCENCHNIQSEWTPICRNCDAFDTLTWRAPPASDVSTAMGVEMLPLLAGAPDGAKAGNEVATVDDAEISEPEAAGSDQK